MILRKPNAIFFSSLYVAFLGFMMAWLIRWAIWPLMQTVLNGYPKRDQYPFYSEFAIHCIGTSLAMFGVFIAICWLLVGLWKGSRWAWFHGVALLVFGSIVSQYKQFGVTWQELSLPILPLILAGCLLFSVRARDFCQVESALGRSAFYKVMLLVFVYCLLAFVMREWMFHLADIATRFETVPK